MVKSQCFYQFVAASKCHHFLWKTSGWGASFLFPFWAWLLDLQTLSKFLGFHWQIPWGMSIKLPLGRDCLRGWPTFSKVAFSAWDPCLLPSGRDTARIGLFCLALVWKNWFWARHVWVLLRDSWFWMLMVHSREHREITPPPYTHHLSHVLSLERVDAQSPGYLPSTLLELGGGHHYSPRLCSQWNWASCWELDQRLNSDNSVHYTLTLLWHTYSQRRS